MCYEKRYRFSKDLKVFTFLIVLGLNSSLPSYRGKIIYWEGYKRGKATILQIQNYRQAQQINFIDSLLVFTLTAIWEIISFIFICAVQAGDQSKTLLYTDLNKDCMRLYQTVFTFIQIIKI